MSDFYTNVQVFGNKILYRGVENGKRVKRKLDYAPTIYLNSKDKTEYRTITGEYVSSCKPGDIKETRDFIKQYESSDFPIHGLRKYEYTYIFEEFPEEIDWDIDLVNIANIDIEVGSNVYAGNPTKKIKIRKKK